MLVASAPLLAMASFECVAPLPAAALELRETLAAGERLLEDRPARAGGRRAIRTGSAPIWILTVALEGGSGFPYADEESWALRDVDLRVAPGRK